MFVTLEGPEGAGKSTVAEALAARLRSSGRQVVVTREPGAGEVGKTVRHMLLHGDPLDPLTEAFLFLADRAEHVAKVLRPALAAGKDVVCDRFADSTLVYQGHARGLDVERLRELNAMATGGLQPDLTLLLDVDPQTGVKRANKGDRLDKEPLDFHQKVRDGFLAEAQRDPGRWRKIDASLSVEGVVEACWDALSALV